LSRTCYLTSTGDLPAHVAALVEWSDLAGDGPAAIARAHGVSRSLVWKRLRMYLAPAKPDRRTRRRRG
jgi:hypothetical protein